MDCKYRPDLISLFKKNLKNVNDYDSIKAHILTEDYVKIPSLQVDSIKISPSHNLEVCYFGQNKKVPSIKYF